MNKIKAKGEYVIKTLKNGIIIEEKIIPNIITDNGLNALLERIGSIYDTNAIQYIALGTDATSALATDTLLGSEVWRKAPITIVRNATTLEVKTLIEYDEQNNVTFREIGAFGVNGSIASDTGVLISRAIINHTKSPGTQVEILWKLTLARL